MYSVFQAAMVTVLFQFIPHISSLTGTVGQLVESRYVVQRFRKHCCLVFIQGCTSTPPGNGFEVWRWLLG